MYPGPFNLPHGGLFELLRGRGVNIIADRYPRHTKLIKIQIRSLDRLLSVVCGTWIRAYASAPAAGTPDSRGAGPARTAPSSLWPPACTPYAVSMILERTAFVRSKIDRPILLLRRKGGGLLNLLAKSL